MTKTTKRSLVGRGKGYLNAAGTQARFIIFLIFVLVAYTFLLMLFQKLALFPQIRLPAFLAVSLLTLLAFIGIVGAVYSHAFAGPLKRIRNVVDRLAQGDFSVSIRLRESDDRLLKDLVEAITRLCEHARNTNALINESARDLFSEISSLREAVRAEDNAGIRKHTEGIRIKQEILEKELQAWGKL